MRNSDREREREPDREETEREEQERERERERDTYIYIYGGVPFCDPGFGKKLFFSGFIAKSVHTKIRTF